MEDKKELQDEDDSMQESYKEGLSPNSKPQSIKDIWPHGMNIENTEDNARLIENTKYNRTSISKYLEDKKIIMNPREENNMQILTERISNHSEEQEKIISESYMFTNRKSDCYNPESPLNISTAKSIIEKSENDDVITTTTMNDNILNCMLKKESHHNHKNYSSLNMIKEAASLSNHSIHDNMNQYQMNTKISSSSLSPNYSRNIPNNTKPAFFDKVEDITNIKKLIQDQSPSQDKKGEMLAMNNKMTQDNLNLVIYDDEDDKATKDYMERFESYKGEDVNTKEEVLIKKHFFKDFKSLKEEVVTIQNNLKCSEAYNKKLEEVLLNQNLEINKIFQNFLNLREENETLKRTFNELAHKNINKDCQRQLSKSPKDCHDDMNHTMNNNCHHQTNYKDLEFMITKKALKFYVDEIGLQKKKYEKKLKNQEDVIQDLRKMLEEKDVLLRKYNAMNEESIEHIKKYQGNTTTLSNLFNSTGTNITTYLKLENTCQSKQPKKPEPYAPKKNLMLGTKYCIDSSKSYFPSCPSYRQNNQINNGKDMILIENTLNITQKNDNSSEKINQNALKLCKAFEERIDKLDKLETEILRRSSSQNKQKTSVENLSPADMKYFQHMEEIQEKLNEKKKKNNNNKSNPNKKLDNNNNLEIIEDYALIDKQGSDIRNNKNNHGNPLLSKINEPNHYLSNSNNPENQQQQQPHQISQSQSQQLLDVNRHKNSIPNAIYDDVRPFDHFNRKESKNNLACKSPVNENLINTQKQPDILTKPSEPLLEVPFLEMSFEKSFSERKKNEIDMSSLNISPILHKKKKKREKKRNIHHKNNKPKNVAQPSNIGFNDQNPKNELSATDSSINLNSRIIYDINQNPPISYPYDNNKTGMTNHMQNQLAFIENKQKQQQHQQQKNNHYQVNQRDSSNFSQNKDVLSSDDNFKAHPGFFKKSQSNKCPVTNNGDHNVQIDVKHFNSSKQHLYNPQNYLNINEVSVYATPKSITPTGIANSQKQHQQQQQQQSTSYKNPSNGLTLDLDSNYHNRNSMNKVHSVPKNHFTSVGMTSQNNQDDLIVNMESSVNSNNNNKGFFDDNKRVLTIYNPFETNLDNKADSSSKRNGTSSSTNKSNQKIKIDTQKNIDSHLIKSTPTLYSKPESNSNNKQDSKDEKNDSSKGKYNHNIEDNNNYYQKNVSKFSKHKKTQSNTTNSLNSSPSDSMNIDLIYSNNQNHTNTCKNSKVNKHTTTHNNNHSPNMHQSQQQQLDLNLNMVYSTTNNNHSSPVLKPNNNQVQFVGQNYKIRDNNNNWDYNPNHADIPENWYIQQQQQQQNTKFINSTSATSKAILAKPFQKEQQQQALHNSQKFQKSDLVMDFHHLENVPILTQKDIDESDRNFNRQSSKQKSKHKHNHQDKHSHQKKLKALNTNNLNINENYDTNTIIKPHSAKNLNSKEYRYAYASESVEAGHNERRNSKKDYNNIGLGQYIQPGGNIFNDITNNVDIHSQENLYHHGEWNYHLAFKYKQFKNPLPFSNTMGEYNQKTGKEIQNQNPENARDYQAKLRNRKLDSYKEFYENEKIKDKPEREKYDTSSICKIENDRLLDRELDNQIQYQSQVETNITATTTTNIAANNSNTNSHRQTNKKLDMAINPLLIRNEKSHDKIYF